MDILILSLLIIIGGGVAYLVYNQPRTTSMGRTRRPIFVDTSVLIDGRIVDIAKSGFISDTLVIPRSVIGELQYLADNADHEKRSRARHGLDVVRELQTMPGVVVEIMQDGSHAKEGVDERLLSLAKRYDGAVCTIDFNLNKVAQVEDIMVLNVNELAKTLRMAYLPGETLRIELTQKGQDGHQAVGHLPDGTMVVVEQASKKIGSVVEVEFIRSLQTAAGRMMFARLASMTTTAATETSSVKKVASKNGASGRRPAKPTKGVVAASPVKPTKNAPRKAGRQKTQSDREASLIELVNSQDD